MNRITIDEAREHLGQLCDEAEQGKRVLLSHGSRVYAIVPFDPKLEPNWDDAALEAALLTAVEGPHHSISLDDLRAQGERSIANQKAPAR